MRDRPHTLVRWLSVALVCFGLGSCESVSDTELTARTSGDPTTVEDYARGDQATLSMIRTVLGPEARTALLTWDAGRAYTAQFRVRVDAYGSAQGTRIRAAGHLLTIALTPEGIDLSDGEGAPERVWSWQADTRAHDYTVVAEGSRADLYLDQVFVARFELNSDAGTGTASLEHWVEGPDIGRVFFDQTRVDRGAYLFERTFTTPEPRLIAEPPAKPLLREAPKGLDDHEPSALGDGDAKPMSGEARQKPAHHAPDALALRNAKSAEHRVWGWKGATAYVATFAQAIDGYGARHGFAVHDGAYRVQLEFQEAGVAAQDADGTAYLLHRFSDATDARARHEFALHVWRDVVSGRERAKGQLYVDGVFRGEWNLEPFEGVPIIGTWIVGSTAAEVQLEHIRVRPQPRARHAFVDDFNDSPEGESPDVWMQATPLDQAVPSAWTVQRDVSGDRAFVSPRHPQTTLALLHVFARDATMSGRFRVAEHGESGTLWFNLRRNAEESRLVVQVSAADGQWTLLERRAENRPVRVLATHQGDALGPSQAHAFEFRASQGTARFVLDGEVILESDAVSHQNYGRVGVATSDAQVWFDDMSYVGDAPVQRGVSEGVRVELGAVAPIQSASTGILRRSDGSLWLTNTPNTCFVSRDDGRTFAHAPALSCGTNVVESKRDGNLSRLVTYERDDGEGVGLRVERSETGEKCRADTNGTLINAARCWAPERRRVLFEDAPRGLLMPGKLTQTRSGRLLVASTERPGAGGGLRVYYSDDHEIWQRAETILDYATFGINMEAGKVIELSDGRLKLFMRTNLGALYESASDDGGAHWSAPIRTVFRSPRADFNVERDPITGAHYMLWEYDDPNERRGVDEHGQPLPMPSRGRTRLALAVSHDDTRTWQYLLTLDDWEGHPFRHMNGSLLAYNGIVWVTVARRMYDGDDFEPDIHDLAYFRVDTSEIDPTSTFPDTH